LQEARKRTRRTRMVGRKKDRMEGSWKGTRKMGRVRDVKKGGREGGWEGRRVGRRQLRSRGRQAGSVSLCAPPRPLAARKR
jgi:hypothetical protein